MKLFSWQKGRQGSGYQVLTLINSKLLKFDLHIIRYPYGSYIPYHTDPARPGYEHHRVNFVFKRAKYGGNFITEYSIFKSARLNYFRPDLAWHGVTRVEQGSRYVLSIGWLRKKKV